MYDGHTRLGQQVLADAHEQHGLELLPPPVPKSVKVAEAPGRSRSVLQHAPHSPAADAYRELAANLDSRIR
jgi:chromosome partitioning protein